jgi:DNA-binding MarR family transcriptional regulator
MRTLDSLGIKELIAREPDLFDRRSNIAALTAAGRGTLHGADMQLDAAEHEVFSWLSPEQYRHLLRSLNMLMSGIVATAGD